MLWPEKVLIREVGPRDGLQSAPRVVPTAQKIAFIERLLLSGIKAIEVTSFVHPRAVPQMADAEAVVAGVRRLLLGGLALEEKITLSALAGNLRGVERALAAGVDEVVMVVSATEEHNQANMHMSIGESLKQLREAVALASGTPLVVRGAVAVAFGCPYHGKVGFAEVARVVEAMLETGVREITLADTAGLANPWQVYELVSGLARLFPEAGYALHLHNARGLTLANLVTGLQAGIRVVESAAGGLGGCPFIPGAPGNVATEEVVDMLAQMGIETGVDGKRLRECVGWLRGITDRLA